MFLVSSSGEMMTWTLCTILSLCLPTARLHWYIPSDVSVLIYQGIVSTGCLKKRGNTKTRLWIFFLLSWHPVCYLGILSISIYICLSVYTTLSCLLWNIRISHQHPCEWQEPEWGHFPLHPPGLWSSSRSWCWQCWPLQLSDCSYGPTSSILFLGGTPLDLQYFIGQPHSRSFVKIGIFDIGEFVLDSVW